MNSTSLCRLCICAYTESKSLFDEFGQGNDLYEITVKYFDPMFLNSLQHPQLSMAICVECWHHINDFHTFQQSVLSAQKKLDQEYKQIVSNIKVEDDMKVAEVEPTISIETQNEVEVCDDVFRKLVVDFEERNEVFLPDLYVAEIEDNNPFSTDDDKPLINSLPKSARRKRGRKPKREDTYKECSTVNNTRKPRKQINTASTAKNKTTLKLKIKAKDTLGDKISIVKSEIETRNSTKESEVNAKLENNAPDSIQSSNDDDNDNHDYVDSDNNDHQADPDEFVSSNDKQKTSKQKTQEIDAFIAEWKQVLECDLCNQAFMNLTLLRKHFSTEHPQQKCYVSCCQRKLKYRFDIVEHIRFHIDPFTFKCKICGNVSANSYNLNKHMHEKHTAEGLERPFECYICQKSFAEKCKFKTHMKTHDTSKDFKCSEWEFENCNEQVGDHSFKINNITNNLEFPKRCSSITSSDELPIIAWKNAKVSNSKIATLPKTKNICDNIKKNAQTEGKRKQIASNGKKEVLKDNGIQAEKDKIEKNNSQFNLKKARESDAFIREWKPILECDLCEETTSSFDKLRSHFKDKHKSRFYIRCCERKFYRRYVLVNHIQLHLKPDTYKCEICGKVSANKNNLKLHKKLLHEKIDPLECKVCHKLFNLKTSLDRHLLTHVTGDKDFICQDCGKAYVLEVQLKSHIRTVHNVDRVCDQCGKTVHGIQALKKHLMEHAGITKPKFPCDECKVEFKSRNGLKRHKAAYHHDGSTIYVCSICGKVAASESALLNHKKYVHEEERKHKCTYCDKAFKRRKNLLEHIATHTGQDLYQCPHCPQTFKVSANMHHHRKKVHPAEWEEGRKNRLQVPKVDINQVKNQIIL